ncbi:MAG: M28 family peptidase [Myxococcota bacterium]
MPTRRFATLLPIAMAAGCSTSFPAPANFTVEQEPTTTTGEPEPLCGESVEAMSACVDGSRYLTDLEFIAAPRPPGDAHWQAVQDLCFDRFTEFGFDVELHQYGTGVNVLGTKVGATAPDETVVVSAHYDHILDCAGADDNATGVAGVLELARVLAEAELERTVIFACWDQEEIGLIGSRSWVLRANENDEQIVANFNFEMIGYTDHTPGSQSVPAGFDLLFPEAVEELAANGNAGDFITVIADDLAATQAEALIRHADRIDIPLVHLPLSSELKNSPLLSDLRRSDHATFWEFDLPAMMLTDTSNFRYAAYHCAEGEDTVDNLDHEFTTKVLRISTAAVVESLGLIAAAPG